MAVEAVTSARRNYDRAALELERLVPLARSVHLAAVVYATLVAASSAVIAIGLLVADTPGTWWTWGGWLVVVLALAGPPLVLALFARMLREVTELPGKLRRLPDVGPAHALALARIADSARRRPKGTRVRRIPRDAWQAGRLVLRARGDVPYVGVVLSIVRLPFLLAVLFSAFAGLMYIFLAPFVAAAAFVANVL